MKLIRRFPLRRIRSDEELDEAVIVINALLDRDDLDPAEADYLDVLADLVERYESSRHPIEDVAAADVLQHLIEARRASRADVARATGIAASVLGEALAGKRSLSPSQRGKLARYFRVDPEVFS